MTDRAMQALYLLGLDPIAETLADGHSYGFRLERCCADALDQCHNDPRAGRTQAPTGFSKATSKPASIGSAMAWLLDHIPMDKEMLAEMVESGLPGEARPVRHHGRDTSRGDHLPRPGESDPGWTATAAGGTLRRDTPQPGKEDKVHLVRYADDFIITGTSQVLLRV